MVTPEGDALTFTSAHYQHTALAEIRHILTEADDFGLADDLEAGPDGAWHFPWYETDPDQPALFAPIGRRVLADLTLTPTTLEVEAMSPERLARCSQRLEQLLGERIHLAAPDLKPAGRRHRASQPASPSTEPFTPPPEVIAQIEDQMLRQWLDEKIPALAGLTPRQAVKTPAGRRQVLDLIDHVQQMQRQMKEVPGMFSPDYRKIKKMLNLE